MVELVGSCCRLNLDHGWMIDEQNRFFFSFFFLNQNDFTIDPFVKWWFSWCRQCWIKISGNGQLQKLWSTIGSWPVLSSSDVCKLLQIRLRRPARKLQVGCSNFDKFLLVSRLCYACWHSNPKLADLLQNVLEKKSKCCIVHCLCWSVCFMKALN